MLNIAGLLRCGAVYYGRYITEYKTSHARET
jgi:hypothetical protein